jgi:hypothetical protein
MVIRIGLVCSIWLLAVVTGFTADNTPPEGFTALFNGQDFTGWHGVGTEDPRKVAALDSEARAKKFADSMIDLQAHWKVDNGELVNDGKGLYMTTDGNYGDYELHIEWKLIPKGDSGVYLKGTPQVQIWDTTPEAGYHPLGADKGSGGLWNNAAGSPGKDPIQNADKPIGEWNKFRILQVGAHTTVYLNDELVVDHAILENYFDREGQSPIIPRGPVQLQTHGNEVRWKNIYLKELSAKEANELLASKGEEGFEPLFNGRDFAGWQGAVESYEVDDGAIRCIAGKGGVLHTTEEYGDFMVRLEFQLPEAGNNGLAIRYPGEGDCAYTGMCELQVLDTEHPKYGQLDPRQAHGSAYGMVPAARGYHRPTGEWNFQEVTVQGSRVKVELNGSVILNADLASVTEFMANTPHPGKDRTTGFFGFAGHSDPVRFRHVRLKRL